MAVYFSRKPYNVTYYKNGERHTIRRQPPPKLHKIWPEDMVSLKIDKAGAFQEGDEVAVKHINPRHPNVLQLENEDGATTFVEHFDVELEEAIGPRDGVHPTVGADADRYLLWP